MGKVIRPLCWHQTFVPWGLSVPALGLYTCIMSWKKKNPYKIRLRRHFLKLTTSEWSDQTFLLTSKLCPLGLSVPAPGLYSCIKSRKNCVKSDVKKICLNLQQMTKVTRCSCWHGAVTVVRPCLGAIYMYKIVKKMYKIWLQRDFLKLVANDRSDKRFLLTSIFCPWGLSAPDLQLYTFSKSWKDVYKVRGWRDSF